VLASRRPVFSELLKALGKGDTLTVVKLDRLGRNAVDVLSLIDTLHEKAISVRISILGLILPNHREGCF
jgi:putative DNA-invertase from lambdoid prophage Rac